jgi:hypothetical protein
VADQAIMPPRIMLAAGVDRSTGRILWQRRHVLVLVMVGFCRLQRMFAYVRAVSFSIAYFGGKWPHWHYPRKTRLPGLIVDEKMNVD